MVANLSPWCYSMEVGEIRRHPIAPQAMITSAAIASRCHDEELVTCDRLYRIQSLEAQLDKGLPYKEAQLACEALKFHQLRQDGASFAKAMILMGVA
jgi:hypothetical protein